MNKTNIFKVIILLSIVQSCFNNNNSISFSSEYVGYWAETEFKYKFNRNGEFIFLTQGHFGNTTTKGKYSIIDSIILLHPFTDWTSYHGVLKRRLVIERKTGCIKDFKNNSYCENIELLNKISKEKDHLIDSIKNRLFELEEVKEITDKYPNYSKFNLDHPNFTYNGIVLIDNTEYHSFQMRKSNKGEGRLHRPYEYIQYRDYLINQEKNEIYKHHSYKDSISKVDRLFVN